MSFAACAGPGGAGSGAGVGTLGACAGVNGVGVGGGNCSEVDACAIVDAGGACTGGVGDDSTDGSTVSGATATGLRSLLPVTLLGPILGGRFSLFPEDLEFVFLFLATVVVETTTSGSCSSVLVSFAAMSVSSG